MDQLRPRYLNTNISAREAEQQGEDIVFVSPSSSLSSASSSSTSPVEGNAVQESTQESATDQEGSSRRYEQRVRRPPDRYEPGF